MLPALYDDQRRALVRLSLMLVVAASMALPLTAPYSYEASAREGRATSVASHDPTTPPLSFPEVAALRDPFVPDLVPSTYGAATTVVRAIVMGSEPRALIDVGGSTRIVRIGDRIGAIAVESIDATGIILAGGVKLRLAEPRP